MKIFPIPGVLFLVLCLVVFNRKASAADTGKPQNIDRKTFSMLLPDGWSEDTKDDMYEPDSFVMFENQDSCLFTVFIGKKSAGMSVDLLFKKQTDGFLKKMTEWQTSSFDKWTKYTGKGITIVGKIGGAIQYSSSVFVFENGDNVCAIVEAATPSDLKKYAVDYDTIRKSFVLK
jgi:hypothetical protein